MIPETIFSAANIVAIVAWLMLVLAPRWRGTRLLVLAGVIPLLLAGVYLLLVVVFFGHADGGFDSLAGVRSLFANDWALLAGWIHYLAFDLLVGGWEVKDSAKRGVSHLLVVPCLIFTFLLGPIGFLLYVVVRAVASKGEVK